MNTSITGVFPDHRQASLAAASLLRFGFRDDQVRVVGGDTQNRHAFIHRRSADARRAAWMGTALGTCCGVVAGALLATPLGIPLAALWCGLAGAAGGAVLGLVVGRSTTSQIEGELENQVNAGAILVSVTTDEVRGSTVVSLLEKAGGSSIASSFISFTAGVLPVQSPEQSNKAENRVG